MKRTLEHKALQRLPFVVSEKLIRDIDLGVIDLICITSLPFSPICKVTVVVSREVLPEKKLEMQNALWIKEAYEQFKIVVCFCVHSVFPFKSDFHFTYLALNLHPRFIAYSRTEKTWQSLFHNYYHFLKRNQWIQMNRWLAEIEEKHSQYLGQNIAPLWNENQLTAVSILYKEMIRGYFHAIQNMLFPSNVEVIHSEWELLGILKQYYPDLYSIFVNEECLEKDLHNLLESTHTTTLTKANCQNLYDVLNRIASRFKIEVKRYFEVNIETLLHDTDGELVFTKAQYEWAILNKIIDKIKSKYKSDLIYLINSKDSNHGMEFKLLLVGVGVTANIANEISMDIKNLFKQNVEVTVLLHNLSWLYKYAHNFLPFVYRYITPAKLLYSKKQDTHLNFIYPVFEIADTSTNDHKVYWQLCKNNLENMWEQINQREIKQYKLHDIANLRSVFKQLCMAYLYKKMHYVPHLKGPKYLWRLVQWVDDDFSINLMSSENACSFFTLLSTRQPYFPTEVPSPREPKQEEYKNALNVCNTFYNHVKEFYKG